jgi:hypothetical protein
MLPQLSLTRGGLRNALLVLLAVALTVTLLPAIAPAHAATAIIGRFYATCGTFSADLAVNGSADDGGGIDRFRFLITDNTNKKLYSEDSSRPLNVTRGAVVTNMSFDADGIFDGPPTQNPIRISIIDLNNAGQQTVTLATMAFDAKCLPGSGQATFSGDFQPPNNGKALINVTTPLLNAPGGAQIGGLVAEAGKEFIAVYRSLDGNWISIYVGSPDLPWIATNAASVDIARLPVQPVRIDSPSPVIIATLIPTATPFPIIQPGTPTPIGIIAPPTTVTGYVRVRLRLRAQPLNTAPILTTIPFRTFVPVYGKDTTGRWVKVIYNGMVGWVAVRYVRLEGATLNQLPVTS